MTGPLTGTRVVELAGIGPAPFAGMLLADLGADVVRIDRPVPEAVLGMSQAHRDVVNRGKRSVAIDLKNPAGRDAALELVAASDVLIEGFRPGVAERLGLGPADCAARNPKLVYGRMTGWGQDGPMAHQAGHDVNYIAITGALWAIGREGQAPQPPLNLLGDYAGGSMFLVTGILAALIEAARSGQGQVVDAAMVDGTSVLATMFSAMAAMGVWDLTRRFANPIDTGAPWYDVYECADGKWLSVGAIEPQFYADLVRLSGFREGQDDTRFAQGPQSAWAAEKAEWAAHWKTRPRDEWAALLQDSDACAQPVLTWQESEQHPHLVARQTRVTVDGITQPAPAPRLSRTPLEIGGPPPVPGQHTREVLADLGLDVDGLLSAGVVAQSP